LLQCLFDPGVFNLELVFNTTKLTTSDGIVYRDDTNLSEAQVSLINNCFRPLTETAGKLMKEAGHPLQYRPEVESYYLSFSTCEIPLITEYLETLASGYE
jgi:hypothetical protein